MRFELLERVLGYRFKNSLLLRQALTHRSYGKPNNERLEFLGDALLNAIVTHFLYEYFPERDEGVLSYLKANWVNQSSLVQIAFNLSLDKWIFLGRGEKKSGGAKRPSILADVVEALVGAIFLDSDFPITYSVTKVLYKSNIENLGKNTFLKDPKTELQEFLQGKKLKCPIYSLVARGGVAHKPCFEVACAVEELSVSLNGKGSSLQMAEQVAAQSVLKLLKMKS